MPLAVAGVGTPRVASVWGGLLGREQVAVDWPWRLGLCNQQAVVEGLAVPVWWGQSGVESAGGAAYGRLSAAMTQIAQNTAHVPLSAFLGPPSF